MRLVSARVRGLGRLLDTTIKLDQKIVAIVGPNEAGKSTLLKALAYVDSKGSIPAAERSRASSQVTDSTPISSLTYRLSEEDQKRLAHLDLAEAPIEFKVSRLANGEGPIFEALPHPRRNETPLKRICGEFGEAIERSSRVRSVSIHDDDQRGKRRSERDTLLAELTELWHRVEEYLAGPPDERGPYEPIQKKADQLRNTIERGFTGTGRIPETLLELSQWTDKPDPSESVYERLWSITPDVVMFDEADRELASSYTLGDELLRKTPPALTNLARLAGLDLKALVVAVSTSDIGRRDTLKARANKRLSEVFAGAWKQSNLSVVINIEGTTLRIGLIENQLLAYQFHERSAGLRMFVAITAFLAARDTGRPTILLIDEAETHLHIDAQADLVQMFAEQDKADKIVYTTHSPACLPADLGVGIRAVVPTSDEISCVENHYWRLKGAGFTSLMIALGASAAAFTPARCAVIGEGATEMILLPRLMREATGLDNLPYQVTPGLSEIPAEAYPDLDFQAAKVAFLVDGDKGGAELGARIGRAVPPERVATLAVCGIENTLDSHTYQSAYLAVMTDINEGAPVGNPPALPDPQEEPWARAMERWAKECGLRAASKRDVANYIIELEQVGLSEIGRTALAIAHQKLLVALDLGHDQPAEMSTG